MEFLDKLIPLAILGVVAGFLVFLLRRAARQEYAAPRLESEPIQVQQPAAVNAAEPIVAPPPLPVATTPAVIVEPKVRKRRSKKTLTPVVAATPVQSPVVMVLDLLKQKDTLAAAFLLREILAPPVSKSG